ncbi:DEAD/DEAH box helicase [Neolewinella antarctica]|uniref:Non-specific serine/threonine protein kinase n=1 Tax=Neolewinella antarctica TaxID=442734 RepID=A0ABX0X754_9BACT|nr:DEAD/DEAH box helicase [Neolewinella antarctica]NJC24677.1 non-specific serine/threonine protein kinase [Neolewinella antarctica]
MNTPEILFDFYEYRHGLYLPKAYVVGRSPAGRLVHVHHVAKAHGLGQYAIELTEGLARALQLLQALKPAAIAESFRKNKKTPVTLPTLLSNKNKDRDEVIRYAHHRSAEVLELCKEYGWAVSVNVNVRGVPEESVVKFSERAPVPEISFTLREDTCTYTLRVLDERGAPSPIRHHDWRVITNHPTPGWLVYDGQLVRFGGLNGNHVKPFLTKDVVTIPRAEFPDFWRGFVTKIAVDHPVIAEGFAYREVSAPDCLRLSARLHPFEHRYLIYPEFVYAEKAFSVGESKQRDVAHNTKPPYALTRILRDADAELLLLDRLLAYGLTPIAGTAAYTVSGSDRFASLEWLLGAREELELADVEVIAPSDHGQRFTEAVGSITIEFTDYGDWLDLKGTVIIGEHRIPFVKLVRFLQREERCFPLPDGNLFLIPAEWFSKYRPSLQFAKIEGKKVRLARSQAPLLLPLGLKISDDSVTDQVAAFRPSEQLKATLRPYQLTGVKWLVKHYYQQLGACLADDMGLGKTLQTIAVLLFAKEQLGGADVDAGQIGERKVSGLPPPQMDLFAPPATDEVFLQPLRALVVLPASLIYNWHHELERFAPGLTVLNHTGSKRQKDARVLRRFDVILTTYQTAQRDKHTLKELEFSYVVLDESQQIKNRQSKIFKALNELSATHRISLSGTPIENSLSDLWSQMQFINPGLLRGYTFFKREFIDPIEQRDDELKKDQLRRLVSPHLLRRTKAEVAPELPELEIQVYYCEMTTAHRKAYERELSAARNALLGTENPDDGGYKLKVIQTLTRLRQLANHPILLDDDYDQDSGKFTEVLAQWETLRRSGNKVLIFSSMVKHLELFRERLRETNEPYTWISGSTPTDKRAREVERFQTDPAVSTFFLSIKAAGTGLNLTAADYIFILDPWWNPSTEDQAIARAHRIGRVGNVFARKFITKGTIEEKINKLQQRKKRLAEDIIGTRRMPKYERGEIAYLLE